MSWFHRLLGYDEANAQRAAEADAQLRAINDQRAGELGETWRSEVDRNYSNQVTFGVDAQQREINVAFGEGLKEGAGNITGFVSGAFKFVGRALSAVLLGIPVWAWLAVAAVIWVYLGTPGLKTLKKKLPA